MVYLFEELGSFEIPVISVTAIFDLLLQLDAENRLEAHSTERLRESSALPPKCGLQACRAEILTVNARFFKRQRKSTEFTGACGR
jgi:hypothetical protein